MSERPTEAQGGLSPLALKLLGKAGVDRAVGFTVLRQGWVMVSLPVTLYLVTTYFSKEIQGFYFTFASLLFFQVFIELGFGTVMLQFVSHEWAHLRFNDRNEIEGDTRASSRLASLIRLALKWYLVMGAVFFVVVGVSGDLFLSQHATKVSYRAPWWLLCAVVSLSFPLVPLRGVLEGSNRIDANQKTLIVSGIVSSIAGWLAIISGAGLYALAVINGFFVVVSFALLIPLFRPYSRLASGGTAGEAISWRREFWPLQWRIGTSWLCGFFMFQSFVPFIFQFHGPVAAGKMGATLAVYNAVNMFTQSWLYAVSPQMGMMSARGEFRSLVALVRKTYFRSVCVSALLAVGAFIVIAGMKAVGMQQAERFTDLASAGVLLLTAVAMQLSHVETQAIRFQKKEPFVKVSIISALLVVLSNLFLGRFFGIPGVIVGFAGVMLMFLIPGNHIIYKNEMRSIT